MGFVLGLSGPASAGKDTVADYLVNIRRWDEKISFASNLKEMCVSVFSLSPEDVNTQKGKRARFKQPVVFDVDKLRLVINWMSRTHPNLETSEEGVSHISSLVGKKLHTPREIIQFVGTEVCRGFIPSYHIDIIEKYINENRSKNLIVTDVRFPDEGDMVLNSGGVVARVERDNLDINSLNRNHASETSMDGWAKFTDAIKNNKEGLSFLYDEIDNFLERNNLCLDAEKTAL